MTKEMVVMVIVALLEGLGALARKTPWSFDNWMVDWLNVKKDWLVDIVWTILQRVGADAVGAKLNVDAIKTAAVGVINEKGVPS